jgi:hypothetical protein
MFGKRSFLVKVVKDKMYSDDPIDSKDPLDNIRVAQGYADLAVNTATDLAKIAITVILVKTACNLACTAANALTK